MSKLLLYSASSFRDIYQKPFYAVKTQRRANWGSRVHKRNNIFVHLSFIIFFGETSVDEKPAGIWSWWSFSFSSRSFDTSFLSFCNVSLRVWSWWAELMASKQDSVSRLSFLITLLTNLELFYNFIQSVVGLAIQQIIVLTDRKMLI